MAEPQTRPGLDATQKLQVVVGNCFQKAVELILHARIMPLTPELNRGASNEWVRLRMRAARSRDLPARALANVFSPAAVLARPQFDVRSEELLRVHDELEAWRRDISQPLQLDIFMATADAADKVGGAVDPYPGGGPSEEDEQAGDAIGGDDDDDGDAAVFGPYPGGDGNDDDAAVVGPYPGGEDDYDDAAVVGPYPGGDGDDGDEVTAHPSTLGGGGDAFPNTQYPDEAGEWCAA